MTVKQLYDKLGSFPPDLNIMILEKGDEYYMEIEDVSELTSPVIDSYGIIIGEQGEGELILTVK
ncbi:hypothetical protein AAHN97_15080 [Chitinophaga niabensis]|uniref:hypothetical protein n=1 Tax=Chitinophaga niabensis TaxID=536979 RepID=UPI0031B9D322